MKIEIVNEESIRGPVGYQSEVFMKAQSVGGSIWYIIKAPPHHDTDNSPVESGDTILYGSLRDFPKKEELPNGYTWISAEYCREFTPIDTNKEAVYLLSKEE